MTGTIDPRRDLLTVVGFVYFEVFLPERLEVPSGEEVFVPEIPLGLGGAVNTASVAAALGQPVILCHPSGLGLADLAVRRFVAALGLTAIQWPAKDNPSTSLVLSRDDDRSFVSAADFSCLPNCPELPESAWVHVAGLREAFEIGPQIAAARQLGAKVSVSGCWAPDALDRLRTLDHQPWDLLFLNRAEATYVAGKAEDAPAKLSRAAKSVVVTTGKEGAFGVVGGKEVRSPSVPREVVDLTGAGDAFAAGFIAARMRKRSAPAALEFANRVASLQVGLRGGVAGPREIYEEVRSKL